MHAMKDSGKKPGWMRFPVTPVKWRRTQLNRIVTIVIWKKNPIVPVVKLSWMSAKTAAEILRANSGSAEPG
jgi:hypothetical protein